MASHGDLRRSRRVAIVLIAAGAGAFAFIAPLGCALMMGMMIWMMVRPGGHGGG